MDHSCEKCGVAVEDGRPFCPHCRAPQIHVLVTSPAGDFAGREAADEPLVRIPQIGSFDRPTTLEQALFDRGAAVRAAIKAGVLGVFVGVIPLLGIVLTGSLAVYFYRREKGMAPAIGIGARLGGAAGVVAFGINSLLIAIRTLVFHGQQEYIDMVLKFAQAVGYNTGDAEVQSMVHNLFTPSWLALTFFFGMIFSVVLASAGGALAGLVMRRPPRG